MVLHGNGSRCRDNGGLGSKPAGPRGSRVSLDDIDLFEVHDSYASIGVAFERMLEIDREKLNIYGGGLALGHPYAASGTRVAGTLINALQRKGGGYGLGAVIGAGGVATAIVLDVRAPNGPGGD